MQKLSRSLALVFGVSLVSLPGCNSSPAASPAAAAGGSPSPAGNPSPGSDANPGSPVAAPPNSLTPSTGTAAATPSSWCAAAATTQIVARQSVAPVFAALCQGGVATNFFVNTLIPGAFAGSGAPTLADIQPVSDNNGSVTAFFGAGIKMPISAETHFSQIAPLDGTVAEQNSKIKTEGGTPGNVSIQQENSNSDTGWVRGWVIEDPSSSQAGLLSVRTDYTVEEDQYQLGTGLFMYTSTLTNSAAEISDYETVTAVLDINGVGYQLIAARISASDQGQASQATSTLNAVAGNLIKFMYQQAASK